ncbi:unnamed protein product [Rhodiola kirilowii]
MPQKGILEVEVFDVWGIDFMGPSTIFTRKLLYSRSGRLRV